MSDDFPWPEGMTAMRRRDLAALLWDLADNGPVESPEGHAAPDLRSRLIRGGRAVSIGGVRSLINLMSEGGRPGSIGSYLLLDRNPKRIFSIALAKPHDELVMPPRSGSAPTAPEAPEEVEEVEEVEEEPEEVGRPGELELHPIAGQMHQEPEQESVVDRVLFAISLLTGTLEDLARVQVEDPHLLFDQKLTAVNEMIERNQRLSEQLADAQAKNAQLMLANRQLERTIAVLQRR